MREWTPITQTPHDIAPRPLQIGIALAITTQLATAPSGQHELMATLVRPWLGKPDKLGAQKVRYPVEAPTSTFHQGQWLAATGKVRMYDCNLYQRVFMN
jgi:hypothetical protein